MYIQWHTVYNSTPLMLLISDLKIAIYSRQQAAFKVLTNGSKESKVILETECYNLNVLGLRATYR